MGLSGRKQKQRIGNDPRNLSWADDAARFGSNYLSKFGWNSSQGLGADGEGRTSHLKVAQKLDMLGIGAAHTKDPNGIAWKQNKDFENLLARLNGGSSGSVTPATKVDGFASATVSKEPVVEKSGAVEAMDVDEKDEDGKKKKKKEKKEKKDKKRKRGDGEEDGADTHKKAKVEEATPTPTPAPSTETTDSAPSDLTYKRAYVPRHRAHRARAIAAKSIASKSTNHISEILGVAPESSATSALASESATPPDQGKLTVISDSLEKLTTSTKSVADYFKERLMAKAAAKSGSSTPQTPADSTPSRGDEEEKPRGGLGFAGIGMRRVEESSTVEDDTLKLGLSKFSSLMSSTFLSSAMSFAPATQDDTPTSEEKDEDEDEKADEAERKRLKEEKAKRKAEKAKKKAEKAAAKAAENSSEEEESKRKKEKKSKKKNKKKEKGS